MDSSPRILLIIDRKLVANSVDVPGEEVVSSRAEVTWGCLRVTLETLALPLPLLLEIPFSAPAKAAVAVLLVFANHSRGHRGRSRHEVGAGNLRLGGRRVCTGRVDKRYLSTPTKIVSVVLALLH